MNIQIKRVYEEPNKDDGKRILIDRLWPRGLTKEKAAIDLWIKEISPTTDLRKWFGHEEGKWDEFKKRYTQELQKNHDLIEQLIQELKSGKVTLVYGAKDIEHNDAIVLKEYLEQKK